MAATRQLGFRLSVIGSDKTVNELDLIKKKLVDVQKQIKSVQANKISLNTSFDAQGINDLLKVLGKVKETKLSPEIVATIKELKTNSRPSSTGIR
ncbi:MAG: hypothetical protein IPM42_22310 [Saprospiraceae bacterium]|nr:hypothetical protein [Saprospiraceae bacterium]